MSNTVIKVENLSKQYRLGVTGTGTLSHDLNRWWHLVRGKEDPYQMVGETNEQSTRSESGYVWALKDINFEVQQGEVLGIIGKNGAGKSTLLKILSKVTGPTTGKIKAKGRIASLLEVGTGFHPELTGKENIYLNGTILGMTRREVSRKLDEIVDFAGVARYVDTPVKRYSSGMKVRLGFAVAAHLEPDILIVDEVLAVGDAEFQRKAVGKMKEVSEEEGRTILFVSHNMVSVKSICSRGALLEDGRITRNAEVDSVVSDYLFSVSKKTNTGFRWENNEILIKHIYTTTKIGDKQNRFQADQPLNIIIVIDKKEPINYHFTLQFKAEDGTMLFASSSMYYLENELEEGEQQLKCTIPEIFFNIGTYYLNLLIIKENQKVVGQLNDVIEFHISPASVSLGKWMGKSVGYLKPKLEWFID